MTDVALYSVDPDDPRAPPQERWDAMTAGERDAVVASLPNDVPWELSPPEGDPHRKAKESARGALDTFFRRTGRRVYVSSELGVYYPSEPRFAPDVLAVLDVEPHDRDKWVVSVEGKGLDLVIEVHYGGDANKDFVTNVERFARLGIAEYFVLDRGRGHLRGWALPARGAPYAPVLPQAGRWQSRVLGLDLTLEEGRLRFYSGNAPLLEAEELSAKLERMVDDVVARRDAEAQRADAEAQRANAEAQRANAEAQRANAEAQRAQNLERQLAEALAEIDRLRRGG